MESEPPPKRVELAEQTAQPQPEPETTGSATRWWALRPDPLLVACFAALFAFPLTAALAASRQPIAPDPETAARPPATALGPTVREVPAFTPGGEVAAAVARGRLLTDLPTMRSALDNATGELLHRRGSVALDSLLPNGGPQPSFTEPPYPYRFPEFDRVLDPALRAPLDERTSAAANDLGALLVLAAARFPDALPNAAPLAFAVLDRARAGDACLPQLNLAFLLATDVDRHDAATAKELREAARRCPDDPTPLWLLGQFQSQSARPVASLATFGRLQERFPQSSAGWSGEADTWLRRAYGLAPSRHFTLRSHYRRALALFRQARALDPDPALAAGEARAQAGLRLYAEAARSQRQALTGAPRPAQLQARLVEYLARARAFGAAATEAARLAASPLFPQGPALFMESTVEPRVQAEDGQGALSLGSGRVLGVQLDVAPSQDIPLTDGSFVLDLSFIPEFRDVRGADRLPPLVPRMGAPPRPHPHRPSGRGTGCSPCAVRRHPFDRVRSRGLPGPGSTASRRDRRARAGRPRRGAPAPPVGGRPRHRGPPAARLPARRPAEPLAVRR